jgi:hypothetical protein
MNAPQRVTQTRPDSANSADFNLAEIAGAEPYRRVENHQRLGRNSSAGWYDYNNGGQATASAVVEKTILRPTRQPESNAGACRGRRYPTASYWR